MQSTWITFDCHRCLICDVHQANEREMNLQVVSLTKRIAGLDEEIANETAKLQSNTQGEREEVQRRLQAAQADCEAASQELLGIADEREIAQRQRVQDSVQSKQIEADMV